MERFFAATGPGQAGALSMLAHGPFVSREDVMAFLARNAPAGRWLVFGTASPPEQFDVPDRVVSPVAA